MMIIIKIAMLIGLYRLLDSTNKPFFCAALYAIAIGIANALMQASFQAYSIAVFIGFLIALIYFWLLNRFPSGLLHWVIFIIGIPLFVFI